MKRQTKLVWGLVFALIAVIFVLLNTESVTINFGFAQPRLPLVIILVVMVLLGAVIAWFLARRDQPDIKHQQRKIAAQARQITDLKKQLADTKKVKKEPADKGSARS